MVTIKIGTSEQRFDSIDGIDESWINQQINGLKRDKHSICVRVSIQEGSLHLTLVTPDCQSFNGGRREPNNDEKKALEIWDSLGLNNSTFQGGQVIAFLKQVRRITR